ncbi:hypothetical protein B0H11DRAFT_1908582 [Mycena galericulata]|nr:hypothetical protein B0H11DRAFT_1908582 [Mycena galericulata]
MAMREQGGEGDEEEDEERQRGREWEGRWRGRRKGGRGASAKAGMGGAMTEEADMGSGQKGPLHFCDFLTFCNLMARHITSSARRSRSKILRLIRKIKNPRHQARALLVRRRTFKREGPGLVYITSRVPSLTWDAYVRGDIQLTEFLDALEVICLDGNAHTVSALPGSPSVGTLRFARANVFYPKRLLTFSYAIWALFLLCFVALVVEFFIGNTSRSALSVAFMVSSALLFKRSK